ncbi:basic leucine zipper and w2 domain-containing protein 1 [Plakobranchus ocellatus]|uniref:Basic leucine zipper and w2 domain-containing protein 1 n=1 Tax=Plakobranchus ocellatus TaxID=259542 RepID=A0AAV3ZWR8_9GAST|nr:basic leucine zipper and w2 domain-containing protein 1 [Plakobranchus ocellatus]
MSQKAEKPTLSGTRLKTRKRDEKEKYDPTAFRDSIIAGLNTCGGDLEQVSRYLDKEGSKLDYRRYAEVLFDILFAGGILAPGGFITESADTGKPARSDICVFRWEGDLEQLKNFYEVFYKLIRRYKYLEKAFEDDLKKILLFQKGFSEEEREKLAKITGIILANGLCTPRILSSLFEDHLVKEGISLEFSAVMFSTWLKEKDINSICFALKKQQLDNRLMEMFPLNKRNLEQFTTFFRERGLGVIADMQTAQVASKAKKEAVKYLADMIKEESSDADMTDYVTELIDKQGMSETEVTLSIWTSVMASVEWNKKEDLVAEQALKHLRQYCPLLKATARSPKAELALMLKVQEFCYENMNFLKSFQKIIMLLYQSDVVTEDVILKWYKDGHSAKGKSVFLEQMKKFVEWLQNAEEESDEEEDDKEED